MDAEILVFAMADLQHVRHLSTNLTKLYAMRSLSALWGYVSNILFFRYLLPTVFCAGVGDTRAGRGKVG